MPTPDRLYLVASKALEVIVAAYATFDPADVAPLPDRRYVADGTAVYDCEQLTVQVERVYSTQGATAQEVVADQNCLGMRSATLAITTLRCVPSINSKGQAPKPDAIAAAARRVLPDPTVQWEALRDGFRSGALAPFDNGLAFEAWQAIGPDGGLSGGVLRVRWSLVAGPIVGS